MVGEVREAVAGAVGAGGALGEALIAIKDQPGRTADWLAQVLGISQPSTAHLVRRPTWAGSRGTATAAPDHYDSPRKANASRRRH